MLREQMLGLRRRSASLSIRSLCELPIRFVVHIFYLHELGSTACDRCRESTHFKRGWMETSRPRRSRPQRPSRYLAVQRNAVWKPENSLVDHTRGVTFCERNNPAAAPTTKHLASTYKVMGVRDSGIIYIIYSTDARLVTSSVS